MWTGLLRVVEVGARVAASHLGCGAARSGTCEPTASLTFHSCEQGSCRTWGNFRNRLSQRVCVCVCVFSHRLQFSLLHTGMSSVIIKRGLGLEPRSACLLLVQAVC